MKHTWKWKSFLAFCLFLLMGAAHAEDYTRALRRSQYLLTGRYPTSSEFSSVNSSDEYRAAVRRMFSDPGFYESMLRFHERLYGVGLPQMYLNELQRTDPDGKMARLLCQKSGSGGNQKIRCSWDKRNVKTSVSDCPESWEKPVTAFWREDVVVWACPSVLQTCGDNLGGCFVRYGDQNTSKNSEVGSSDVFDSNVVITRSLSRQSAGIAAAVVSDNFPYTKILEPGLTAVDGPLAHFYRQEGLFDLSKLNLKDEFLQQVKNIPVSDPKFHLIYSPYNDSYGTTSYESGGVLSTFGWLRRYEKNRTRVNQVYERLLCRKFAAELPKVFPSVDPNEDLAQKPGCSGCHATIEPMKKFYTAWGEGADLYKTGGQAQQGTFIDQTGYGPAALSRILQADESFSTCSVQNAWEFLMGRKFYKSEEKLRSGLTKYFVSTNYSFRELLFAIATHPSYTVATRGDSVVTDPLEAPPLGKVPSGEDRWDCNSAEHTAVSYADVKSYADKAGANCANCHKAGTSRRPLESENDWKTYGKLAAGMLASGSMPPGQSGPPVMGDLFKFKETVRCWCEKGNCQ